MKKRVLLFLSVPFFLTAADVFAFPRAKGKLFKPSRVSTAHQAARLVEKFQREANISAKVQQARNIQRGKRAQISSELPFMISHLAQTPPIFHHRVTAVPKEAPVWKAVLPLRETHSFYEGLIEPFTGSSFVIEEEYKGKKYLWGVTAAHVAFLVNGFPAIYSEGLPIPLNIEFAAWGNTGMNDLALFPIPEGELWGFTPLKLADSAPSVGENTYSFGYFNDGFYLVPNREIKEVTPNRIITSLEFDTPNRGGACGGPLLNAKGEVTGVHIGSSDSQHISFVVPADAVKRLLQAYRNNGKSLQPLKFNGVEIGQININESIQKIRTVTNGFVTGDFTALHREKGIDYNRLETLFWDITPDEVHIFISHKAFSWKGDDRHDFLFLITHDFTTGQTTRKIVSEIPY